MKLYYMIGSEDIQEDFHSIDIDLKKPSQYGFTFLTLFTSVQTDFQPLEDNF